VTGLEYIAVAVRDRSPRVLTGEMLGSGEAGRGLGLVADLVGRHGGMVDVVQGPAGWSKSVRVKLPRAAAQR
jgi:signal transduction histidine kinase